MIKNCNFKKEIKNVDDESVDLIVTDPPYPVISGGSGDHEEYDRPKGILKENDGKIFDYNSIEYEEWLPELYRVLKSPGHCYVMINNIGLRKCLNIANDVGFGFHNLLIWKKNNVTPNRWYMKNAEYILFFRKGEAFPINNPSEKQVIEVDNITGDKNHPTEKPVGLFEVMIRNSSEKSDLVFDPFIGTGASMVAAKRLKRNYFGFEIDEDHYRVAKKRLDDEDQKNKFFDL